MLETMGSSTRCILKMSGNVTSELALNSRVGVHVMMYVSCTIVVVASLSASREPPTRQSHRERPSFAGELSSEET